MIKYSDISNDKALCVFGGINVLESEDLALKACEKYLNVCTKLNLNYIFKASFDKANRSSLNSYRGPGIKKAFKFLKK